MEHDIVKAAIKSLADDCDYAINQDKKGFSALDTDIGHALAVKDIWSPSEYLMALTLVERYQKQLRKTGAFNVDTMLSTLKSLSKVGTPIRRMRKEDVVTGNISVRANKNNSREIVIRIVGYHDEIRAFCRNLINSSWKPNETAWVADLCQENAVALANLAHNFGLNLEKSEDWDRLTKACDVKLSVLDKHLEVTGFNRDAFKWVLEISGDPVKDEKLFSAMHFSKKSKFIVALTSWNIEQMHEWLKDQNVLKILRPVKDKILNILDASYLSAKEKEKINPQMSAALTLPLDRIEHHSGRLSELVRNKIMPHQWPAIETLVSKSEVILADQQGLGKTIEVLLALEVADVWPALIICPSIARLNWRDEVSAWLPHRTVHVGGMGKKDTGALINDAEILIINYESFKKFSNQCPPIAAVVCDEAQYLKGYDSQRTENVKQFLSDQRELGCLKKTYLTTGTPIMNRPSELLTLLTLTPGILSAIGGFYYFSARYCRATKMNSYNGEYWDYSGADNLSELNSRLISIGSYLRREKSAVLPDLSGKMIYMEPCDISNREEYTMAKNDFDNWLKTRYRNYKPKTNKHIVDEEASVSELMGISDLLEDDRSEALRQIGILRRLAGVGKVRAAVKWVEENVKDEKLVIFAYHVEIQKAIRDSFNDALFVDGEQSPAARAKMIREFQSDPTKKIIVCSIKAAQTAITLTAASKALIVELEWTPASLEQAEDRLHRIGQMHQVSVTYLVAEDTLDDRMLEILLRKRQIVSKTTATAVFGYKIDGTARMQTPGPGRPRIAPEERKTRKKLAQKSWQERNLEYMREYMRNRRASQIL